MKAISILLGVLLLAACGDEQDAETPVDAGPSTGGELDYATAFPQDEVPRIDIAIPAESWAAMRADMTDMLGEFGSGGGGFPGGGGGGGGGGLPPELTAACEGKAAGDACTATFMGMTIESTCSDVNGQLACAPAGGGGMPPGGGGGGGGGPGGDGAIDLLPRTPVYVECTVSFAGQTWQHVGVRLKGNSSLAMPWQQGVDKLPLRLTFDRYEDEYPETRNQRFFGWKALSLSNGANDPSLVRDKIGTEVFANAGLAVPATAFYRVFLDLGEGPLYYGLYTAIELPSDDAFLETHFGTSDGNLYKPDGNGATWSVFDPETLGKENHEDEADYSDAQALFDALHADRTDGATWRAGLEAKLDVDGFLTWLAVNTVIEDWDTYGHLAHNYYLYSVPEEGSRFHWIPWDHSFAFTPGQQASSLALTEIGDQWPLIRYLLDDPTYAARYRALVGETVATVYEPATAAARFQAAHDLIAPYVVGAEGEVAGRTFLTTPTAFEEANAALLAHPTTRSQEVAEFLAP
jgi:spore coat protein H